MTPPCGHFTINAFDLTGMLGHPATDRLILNLVNFVRGSAFVGSHVADLDTALDKLGIVDSPPVPAK